MHKRLTKADSAPQAQLQGFLEIFALDAGVLENAVQRATLELSMQGHHDQFRLLCVLEADVTALLTSDAPSLALQHAHNLSTGGHG